LNAINNVGLLLIPNASRLRDCLRKRLEACTLCVFDAPAGISLPNGVTFADRRRGWGGDPILINAGLIANAGAETPPVGSYGPIFCDLMLTLVSEVMHADKEILGPDGNPAPYNMATAKQLEKEATEVRKQILERCNRKNGKYYQFLCDWLVELCARADANPTARPDFACDSAGRAYVASTNPVPTPTYGAVYSTENSIYVMTERDDGSDRIEYTQVRHVTALQLYVDTPATGEDTLLVFGLNASQQVMQCQRMTFSEDGWLLGTSSLMTLPHCYIQDTAHVPGSAVTYLLDSDQDEILEYADLSGDGVPETLLGVFADAVAFPGLADAINITTSTAGVVTALDADFEFGLVDLGISSLQLTDTDDDGTADVAVAYVMRDLSEIGTDFSTYPAPGDDFVDVIGTTGNDFELLLTDSAGTPISVLGSGSIPAGTNSSHITLGMSLELGDFVVLHDLTSGTYTAPTEVLVFP
jgi:hypothetical protein